MFSWVLANRFLRYSVRIAHSREDYQGGAAPRQCRTVLRWFHLSLEWRASTVKTTRCVVRFVDKHPGELVNGGQEAKQIPEVMAGVTAVNLNSMDNRRVSFHYCQMSCAPASARTWNPLIKRVERFHHWELGRTASAIAVESGVDKSRSIVNQFRVRVPTARPSSLYSS
jgi:hypothetical protein